MMRKRFLLNILLMMIWVALTGVYTYGNLIFGFLAGFFVMWVIGRSSGERKYYTIAFSLVRFFFHFLYEMFKATIEVAVEILRSNHAMQPGIIRMPLEAKTDLEITLLAGLISLTPGTLVLDVSEDRKVMYIHGMYLKDKEKFIESIKQSFEKPLLQIMR